MNSEYKKLDSEPKNSDQFQYDSKRDDPSNLPSILVQYTDQNFNQSAQQPLKNKNTTNDADKNQKKPERNTLTT